MVRGTTNQHIFDLPFSDKPIKTVRIVYKQGDKKIVKTGEQIIIIGNQAVVRLSQQETLEFSIGKLVEVQVIILTTQGKVLKSKIYKLHIEKATEEEIIT